MAKKRGKHKGPRSGQNVSIPQPKQRAKTQQLAKGRRKTNPSLAWLVPVLFIAVVTWFALSPVLENDFTNLDDPKYVVDNALLTPLTQERVTHFFKEFYFSNYHPLTMVSYMVDYNKVGKEPERYHRVNLVLHTLNTVLVFLFVFLLVGRIEVAAIVSLFFGIHPMHIESVAWISERKDVLYAFFFLLALISYVRYAQKGGKSIPLYLLVVVFFGLSLLSKAAAVVLPVILLLLDWYMKRPFNRKALLEKLPLFVLSLLFGILAVKAQQAGAAIAEWQTFSFPQRMMFACYGITMYISKMFAPVAQSHLYPYPTLVGTGLRLPYVFYVSPFVVLAIVAAVWWSLRKTRVIAFGFLFFLVGLSLVLQIVSVGEAVMAERYTYVPYIGLFFIIGMGFAWLWDRQRPVAVGVGVFLLGVAVAFSYQSHARCKVWKNSETLWTDFIVSHPRHYKGYHLRGSHRARQGRFDEAFADFNMAIQVQPNRAEPYGSRANIYGLRGEFENAMADYNKAIELDTSLTNAYLNRGVTYSMFGDFERAINDYARAIQLDPGNPAAYVNRARAYIELGQADKAVEDCNRVLAANPLDAEALLCRGWALYHRGSADAAIKDLNRVLQLRPNSGMAYLYRSQAFHSKQQYRRALSDAQRAAQLGQTVEPQYIDELKQKSGN